MVMMTMITRKDLTCWASTLSDLAAPIWHTDMPLRSIKWPIS